jgi:hypothetical protein
VTEHRAAIADATRATLLAVRLRPTAEAADLTAYLATLSIAVDDLDTLLGRLELAGLIERRSRTGPGWRLTADGRAEGQRLLGAELDRLDVRSAVTGAYDRFVGLNGELLRVCTAWQLRDPDPSNVVVNDHTDADYDTAVIARLAAIHDRVTPICADLADRLARFAGYAPRFTTALSRILAGDHSAVDTPDTDSYHTIWFELHDHLLATVGADRATEPLP